MDSPRGLLESAQASLVQGLDWLGRADSPELLLAVRDDLDQAADLLSEAAEQSRAWELLPGSALPAWGTQAERIADTVEDVSWSLAGLALKWGRAPDQDVSGVLASLRDSLVQLLLRLEAVHAEVRRG